MLRLRNIKFGFLNPCSLGTRHDEFLYAMDRHNVDVMALNETWLRDGEEGRAPVVPGYQLRHIPRSAEVRSRGGGVGFYIRRGVCARTLTHPNTSNVEQMWLSINVSGKVIIVGTAYRPPWLSVSIFIDALTETFGSLPYHDHILLLGDFNINFLETNSSSTILFKDFLTLTNMKQYVNNPTHFTSHSETLLDLICSDANLEGILVDYICTLSDHAFLSCELKIPKEKPIKRRAYIRHIKEIDNDELKKCVMLIDWDEVNSILNINEMVDAFNSCVIWIFDVLAPLKPCFIKDAHYPWVTYNIKLMMRRRDEAHAKSRKTKNDVHIESYKDLKYSVEEAIYREKTAYFTIFINNNARNSFYLWKNLKRHINIKSKNDQVLPVIFNDPEKINNHFLNVPGRCQASPSDIAFYNSNRFGEHTFSLKAVDSTTVSKILRNLKSNAVGADEISLDMLLSIFPFTFEVITNIINKSITTSIFPTAWQEALIKPIPKKDNPLELKDLRPISILPCISKILEKIIYNQLSDFLESNNILPNMQSGFRKKRGTTTALVDVVDEILGAQDAGQGTILVLLDYSRAFDTINVPLLIAKLQYYGLSAEAINWFASYLSYRTQSVELRRYDGSTSKSKYRPVFRGVPQGSILGPLLFILYSADVINTISHCRYHMYADDIQVYISFPPNETHEAVEKLNEDLNNIASWSDSNCLVLNPTKTKYMILGSKNQIQKICNKNPMVRVQGEDIERVTEARNLGVVMDESLRFEKHILNTVRNCFYRLKVLYRIRPYIKTEVRIRLCESLVLSKLNYADIVTGPRLLTRTKNLIQKVQNACARYCFEIPPHTHVTPFLNNAGIMKMEFRRQLHFATLLFGVVKFKVPQYLFHKLQWASDVHTTHNTRAASYLILMPRHTSAAFRGSFKYNATKCWNNLPPPLRNLNTIICFKFKYKKLLLDVQKQL